MPAYAAKPGNRTTPAPMDLPDAHDGHEVEQMAQVGHSLDHLRCAEQLADPSRQKRKPDQDGANPVDDTLVC